jgi:hypothetical protein
MTRSRSVLKSLLLSCKSKIGVHPEWKAFAVRILSWFPRLERRLRLLENPPNFTTLARRSLGGPECLSPRARQIYFKLKTAIELRQNGNY